MSVSQEQMPIKAEPYAHQKVAFAFACKLFGMDGGIVGIDHAGSVDWTGTATSGVALLMEMGTGKTITSIAIAGALYRKSLIQKVLVVAPLSILGVWKDEFDKFAVFEYCLAILSGTGAKKADTLRHMRGKPLQVAIVNYESAWRMEDRILAWKPDLVICDEGHKIKNHSISASRAMHRIGAKAGYRLLLTGTIITNKAIDVFSQYKFLNPAIFGPSFYAFRNRYFNMVGYGKHTPILKRSMEQDLMRRLHSIAFRATKAECLDLPETIEIVRSVDLEAPAARIYRDLVRDSYAELGQGEVSATNILTRLLRLSQVTGGFAADDSGTAPIQISTAKQDALADIIDATLQEGGKLVIIARFIPEITTIRKMLDKQGIGYACITGEIKERDAEVTRFQTDPQTQVFIGQIATAGLGITLTAASTMVFYSLDYSMSNYEQAKARIHRVGQKEKCTYIYLAAKGTVDEKVLKALRDKVDLARALVDDYRHGSNPFDS